MLISSGRSCSLFLNFGWVSDVLQVPSKSKAADKSARSTRVRSPRFVRWRADVERKNDSVVMRCEDLPSKRYRRDPTVVRASNVPRQRLPAGASWPQRAVHRPVRRRDAAHRRRRSERHSIGFATLPMRDWEIEVQRRRQCGLPRTRFPCSLRDALQEPVWGSLLWPRLAAQDVCAGARSAVVKSSCSSG